MRMIWANDMWQQVAKVVNNRPRVITYCLKRTCLCTFINSTVKSLHRRGAHHWRAFLIQTQFTGSPTRRRCRPYLFAFDFSSWRCYVLKSHVHCRLRPRQIAILTKCMIQCFPLQVQIINNTHCIYSKEKIIICAKFNGTLESPVETISVIIYVLTHSHSTQEMT